MQEYEAGILRTELRANNTYIIDLSCGVVAREAVPGQFIQVRVGCGADPFLRRTFSICGADPECGEIKLMIKVKGQGTKILCSTERSKTVNVIGTMGNGFNLQLGGSGPYVLVAGGMGAAPLVFLAKALKQSFKRQVVFMMGAKNSGALDIIDGLIVKGADVMTATDDGSSGFHGIVSDLLQENISSISPAAIYACGPLQMMKAVAAVAKSEGISCQVSLEERMACGVGACFGCAVQLSNGQMSRTCVDGPVFFADEVYW